MKSRIFASSLFTFALGALGAAPASAAGITGTGTLQIEGKCLDLPGWQTTPGTQGNIYDCNGGTNQVWKLGADGTIRPSFDSSKCLDLPNWQTANGTPIQIWNCNGGSNQQWTLGSNGQLRGYGGKCVDNPGWQTANGTPFHYWDCNGGSNQSFMLVGAPAQNPPAAPSQLTSITAAQAAQMGTQTSTYVQYFTVKDNNAGAPSVPMTYEVWTVPSDGTASAQICGGACVISGPIGGTDLGGTGYFSTPIAQAHFCYKVRATNQFGVSMFSNTACSLSPSTPPPPTTPAIVGLGNGVLVTDPELTNFNYFPTSGDDFRIAWWVCNNGSVASGPLTVSLREFYESNFQDASDHSLPGGVAAGQCVLQYSDVLTSFSISHWRWDVYINNVLQGSTGMSFQP